MQPEDTDFSEGLSAALGTVHHWGVGFYALLPNLVVGIVLMVLFGLVAYAVGRLIRRYFERREREDLGNILGDFGFWGFTLIGCLIALTVIMPSLKPADLLASVGIGSIAIGFAFKDILQNWFAGLLILLRLPFRRGDQIRVLEAEGTVQRIEPRATVLRTYDGRDIVIPNTTIFTNMVTVNTSQPVRRIEINLTVGYNYDIRLITGIIRKALDHVEEILRDPAPQILCWELGSTSLGIKVRWWINAERAQEVISRARAVQAIKEAFDANDIDPTDPQLIFYQHAGKMPFTEDEKAGAQAKQKTPAKTVAGKGAAKKPVTGPAPPKFEEAKGDPESEQPKIDDKQETLLTEDMAAPADRKPKRKKKA